MYRVEIAGRPRKFNTEILIKAPAFLNAIFAQLRLTPFQYFSNSFLSFMQINAFVFPNNFAAAFNVTHHFEALSFVVRYHISKLASNGKFFTEIKRAVLLN